MQELLNTIELPTLWGNFKASSLIEGNNTHILLRYGEITVSEAVITRIHSSCCFGDVFGCLSCDCRAQLDKAIRIIINNGSGLIFYLNQEGRGLGLAAKIEAIRTEQAHHLDTVEAFSKLHFPLDRRNYHVVSGTLKKLGIKSIRLLTNNPSKCQTLIKDGISVTREALITKPTSHSFEYMKAKMEKMGHIWETTLVLQESNQLNKSKLSEI